MIAVTNDGKKTLKWDKSEEKMKKIKDIKFPDPKDGVNYKWK